MSDEFFALLGDLDLQLQTGVAAINGPFPLNDPNTPLFGGANSTQFTYAVPDLGDGNFTVQIDVTNDETVPNTSTVPYTVNEGGGTNGFTRLFDGVSLLFESALVADASDNNPVWTDLTQRVRQLSFSRGRQRELERWEPGTLNAILDNRDRALDPNQNLTVAPMRRVRLQALYNGHSFPLWYGFADSWPQAWQLGLPQQGDAYVNLTATDAFKVFANATVLPSAYYTQVIAANPVGYYRLDETSGQTMADSSLGHRNGNYSKPQTTGHTTAGLIAFDDDTAIAFNGADDYATIPRTAQPVSYPFTISAWFSTSDAGLNPIWYQSSGNTDNHASVFVLAGQIGAVAADGTHICGSDSPTTSYADGNPHHVMVRFQAGNVAPLIAVDGVAHTEASVSNTGTVVLQHGVAFIGLGKSTGDLFAGTLDEVAVFTTDLGPTAAARHYAAAVNPWAGDTSGERVDRILDAINWPTADREYVAAITPGGNTIVASQDLRGKTALESLLQVTDTEFGAGYITAEGKYRFRERHAIYTDIRYRFFQATFGDNGANPTELPWSNLVLASSDELIRNDVQITATTQVSAFVQDANSIAQNLRFTYALSDLLLVDVQDVYGLAYWILNHYANPLQRIEQIQISARHPKNPTDLWEAVLNLDLEDRIKIIRRPPGGGLPIAQEAHIEHIDVSIDPQGAWDVTYQLSPAEIRNVWIWDEAFWDASVWAY